LVLEVIWRHLSEKLFLNVPNVGSNIPTISIIAWDVPPNWMYQVLHPPTTKVCHAFATLALGNGRVVWQNIFLTQ
jgi:hypothetical protein